MATWRYMTEEEAAEVSELPPPHPVIGDAAIHIFEVVYGWVCSVKDGMTLDLALRAPKGWFARPVEKEIGQCTYSVCELKVLMNGQVVDMKPHTQVVFLPPNYRELVDAAR